MLPDDTILKELSSTLSNEQLSFAKIILAALEKAKTTDFKFENKDIAKFYEEVAKVLKHHQLIYDYFFFDNQMVVVKMPDGLKLGPISDEARQKYSLSHPEEQEIKSILSLIDSRLSIEPINWKGFFEEGKLNEIKTNQILQFLISQKLIFSYLKKHSGTFDLIVRDREFVLNYFSDLQYRTGIENFVENLAKAQEIKEEGQIFKTFSWEGFKDKKESENYLNILINAKEINKFYYDESIKKFTIKFNSPN